MSNKSVIREDWNRIRKSRFVRLAVMAILIVPILYSFMYLYAFWDPYNNLDNMKVAVVNLDKGATVDGEFKNVGDEIVSDLKSNDALGWEFVDGKTAADGLLGNAYYAEMIIPANFSAQVMSATDVNQVQGNLTFVTNDKKNFLASQIVGKIETVLENQITSSIVREYTTATFLKLSDLEAGMQTAADGANQLTDGLTDAKDGAATIAAGNQELANQVNAVTSNLQSNTLYQMLVSGDISGLQAIAADASTLATTDLSGIKKVTTTLSQNKSTFGKMITDYQNLNNSGFLTDELKSQVQTIIDPTHIGEGEQLIHDISKLKTDLESAVSTNDSSNLQTIKDNAAAIQTALDSIMTASNQLPELSQFISNQKDEADSYLAASTDFATQDQVDEYQSALASIDTSNLTDAQKQALIQAQDLASLTLETRDQMQTNTSSIDTLTATIDNLNNSLNQTGVNEVFTLSDEMLADNSLQTIIDDIKNINTSYQTYKPTLTTIQSVTAQMQTQEGQQFLGQANTLWSDVYSASPILKQLLNQIDSPQFASLPQTTDTLLNMQNHLRSNQPVLNAASHIQPQQIQTLLNKLPQVSDGVNALANGSDQLSTGITQLDNGSMTLAEGLSSGYAELNKSLIHTPEQMGEFIAQPFALDAQAENKVAQYGVGFAPYFIPLSLWVGALMMFFVVDPRTNIKTSSVKHVLSKFAIYAAIGVLQAVLVSIAIMALGLVPTNVITFIITNIAISLVFVSIMLSLILLLGDIGRLLAIVILILQLTSAGGTFPVDLVPGLFQFLHPILPFTYAVDALRDVISATTINYGLVLSDIGIMAVFGAVFLGLAIIFCKPGVRFTKWVDKQLGHAHE
ncbi:YhgE/Pip domain-containing protein [Culicoidibacter larvae]|uniref:YhgE/Pip domain-containing protein n=1 Tax=Culicoidibacter larvae TaxID=2579976 RepID=A0A5R8Q976_9FIRM|nr:YhgE/Pip domain-containing protein [Culicoidibacter larvae]TLG72460.1 YhgE/Pip domain-containing protein [Culicoidibacter larvae]